MAGIVTLTFDFNLTGSAASITVNGGTIVLEASPSLAIIGTIPFKSNQLSITSGAISILGQGDFIGQISFPLNATINPPTITLTNFAASVTWPSKSGPVTSQIGAGYPFGLGNFQN